MTQARKAMTQLSREVDTGLRAFANEFYHQLRSSTPIRTGFARNSWQNIYGGKPVGTGGLIPLARNNADYIGVLDGKSPKGFTSGQAPQGIVNPALQKTRRKR